MSNRSPRESVDAVLAASTQSTRLYGKGLGMIASENIISPNVKRAINSDLHGRYAEGLPGKRYYQGCDDFDTIEEIGLTLAKKVFQANFANIQSTSGTVSNIGALKALAKPGDSITAVSTADGGHISHARIKKVVLPAPLFPTIPKHCPLGISRWSIDNAVLSPYVLVSEFVVIILLFLSKCL